jgi:transcriptional regulator with XRE-family HTH domain
MHQKVIHCEAYRRLLHELRHLRAQQGLRQVDVGNRLGFSADWVGKIESGELRLDLLQLVRLARVYGVPPDDLVRRFAEGLPE